MLGESLCLIINNKHEYLFGYTYVILLLSLRANNKIDNIIIYHDLSCFTRIYSFSQSIVVRLCEEQND